MEEKAILAESCQFTSGSYHFSNAPLFRPLGRMQTPPAALTAEESAYDRVNPHKYFDQCHTCLYNPDYTFALCLLDCLPDHQMISRVKIYLLINTILST